MDYDLMFLGGIMFTVFSIMALYTCYRNTTVAKIVPVILARTTDAPITETGREVGDGVVIKILTG